MGLFKVIGLLAANLSASIGAASDPNAVNFIGNLGQSNSLGSTTEAPSGLEGVQPNIKIWSNAPLTDADVFAWKPYHAGVNTSRREYSIPANYYAGWAAELTCAFKLWEATGLDTYVVKCAEGGIPISDFDSPSGTRWVEFSTKITDSLAALRAAGKTPIARGMMFDLGESAVVAALSTSVFQSKLEALIDNTRALDPDLASVPFTFRKLSAAQTGVTDTATTKAAINAVFDAVAATKSNCSVVNTDSLSPAPATVDNIHFNEGTYRRIGIAWKNLI